MALGDPRRRRHRISRLGGPAHLLPPAQRREIRRAAGDGKRPALQPFTRERELYKRNRRRPLSKIETAIPLCFLALYVVIIAAAALLHEFVTSPACNF
jgi:hypothetical protein